MCQSPCFLHECMSSLLYWPFRKYDIANICMLKMCDLLNHPGLQIYSNLFLMFFSVRLPMMKVSAD